MSPVSNLYDLPPGQPPAWREVLWAVGWADLRLGNPPDQRLSGSVTYGSERGCGGDPTVLLSDWKGPTMRRASLFLTITMVSLTGWAGAEWHSTLPFIYVLDYRSYRPNHIGNPKYIENVAASPPYLLHLNKDLVFTGDLGPIQRNGKDVRRLTPDEVKTRMVVLTDFVGNLHEVGVQKVMPYICNMTIGGNHETREGFWAFYDHWEEYEAFLGPKIPADPIDWMQRKPGGDLRFFYSFDHYYHEPDRILLHRKAKGFDPLPIWIICLDGG